MDTVKIRDPKLWDCGSSLYDSFELTSFKQKLDSALTSRCMSMPRLSDPYPQTKRRSRVLRSVNKLIRAVFGLKTCSSVARNDVVEFEIYGGYLSSDGLTTIPEGCEKGHESSPEFDSRVVGKTFSERYTSSTSGASRLAS
ncbi:uncharacterized protein A4U43_UnF3210 [Asparagus officinalis]|uniref:Uncharacterized protein n=1 Tax=Asparagus officinalis TaxID=4686 RepID=A0A1R3L767_ASPOF|nr:uncharacterized protein A4U43_UnF3210 [Asparagus officinalis]